jgi:hypothetical protein
MSMMREAMGGSKGQPKWWYGIAVSVMICAFFIGMNIYQDGKITWSVWPVAAVLFFGVGFSLLNKFGRE